MPEVLPENETDDVMDENVNELSLQEEKPEDNKLEEQAEEKPLLVPSGSLLRETMGEISKASGKIIREDD